MIEQNKMALARSWVTYFSGIGYAALLILSGAVSYYPEYLIRAKQYTSMVDSRIMGLISVVPLILLFSIIGSFIWDVSGAQSDTMVGFFGYKTGTTTASDVVTYSGSYGNGSSNFAISRQAFVGIMITMNAAVIVILGLTFFGEYPNQFKDITKPWLGDNSRFFARLIAGAGIGLNLAHICIIVSKADLNTNDVQPTDPYLDAKLTLVYLFVLIMNFSSCYILVNTFFNETHTVASDIGKIAIVLWILVLVLILLSLFWQNNVILSGAVTYTFFFLSTVGCALVSLSLAWKLMWNSDTSPVSNLSKIILVIIIACGLMPAIVGLISKVKQENLAFGVSVFGTILFFSVCAQIVRAVEDVRNGMLIVNEGQTPKVITKPAPLPKKK